MQQCDHVIRQRARRMVIATEDQVRMVRRLIGIINPRKPLDLPGARLSIEPLGITGFAYVQGSIDKDLEKVCRLPPPGDRLTCQLAIASIGADERRERHDSGIAKELRHRSNASDILLPIQGTEAEPKASGEIAPMHRFQQGRRGVQPQTDIVPVQQDGVDTPFPKLPIHGICDRALARTTEPREPDNTPSMAVQLLSVQTGHILRVPGHIDSFRHAIIPWDGKQHPDRFGDL